jgi:hypothetical protein
MENFVKCSFSDKHLIGDNGSVKRLDSGKIKRYGTDLLTGLIKTDGYKMYFIKGKWYYSHRLVASHYINNPNSLSDVNHKDGNKSNNHVDNLEWCSHRDNIKHSYDKLNRIAPAGKDHWNYGKTVSEEARINMSNAKLGRKRGINKEWL